MPEPLRFVTAKEMQIEQVPWCECQWLARPGLVNAQHLLMVRAVMPPGEAHRFHIHPQCEEIIYILEGTAEQWVDREKKLLGPGDIAHIPAGMVHATHNVGTNTLRFLAVLSPAHFDGPALVDVSDDEPWRSLRH